MAYLAARDIQYGNPVGAFLGARDNAVKNALVQRQQANAEEQQAFQNQNALFQRDRLAAADQVTADQRASETEQNDRQQLFTYFSHLSRLKANPDQFNATAQRMLQDPLFQKHGIEAADLTPEQIDEVLPLFAAQAGQAPAARFEEVPGPRGSVLKRNIDTGEIAQVVGPDNTETRQPQMGAYRTLSTEEVARAWLPPGTSAQIGPDGKIDILSKRDNTGSLSQKDATTAKMKINTVALARQQIQKIREAFDEGRKGMNAFGGAQGWLPTQAGKKFDARVNQMRSTLTALTRVPGVGAMSDYETKLDQSKFPTRTAYESVTEDTLNNLDDQLALIERGYTDLLNGNAPQTESPATNSGGWKIEKVK